MTVIQGDDTSKSLSFLPVKVSRYNWKEIWTVLTDKSERESQDFSMKILYENEVCVLEAVLFLEDEREGHSSFKDTMENFHVISTKADTWKEKIITQLTSSGCSDLDWGRRQEAK